MRLEFPKLLDIMSIKHHSRRYFRLRWRVLQRSVTYRMKHLSRVVWSEGMYLGPHHFQAQNRYFEDSVHSATTSLWFQPLGFAGYLLDDEALRNGTLSLVHARGLFPD